MLCSKLMSSAGTTVESAELDDHFTNIPVHLRIETFASPRACSCFFPEFETAQHIDTLALC
jgi:hypothetical protein